MAKKKDATQSEEPEETKAPEENEPEETEAQPDPAEPKPLRVKIGQLMVGKGRVLKVGDIVENGDLSETERAFFIADGTIGE